MMRTEEFLISVQIDPPANGSIEDFKARMTVLKKAGVRWVDVNSSRRISHDSIHLSAALAQMGFDVIPHITTRDSSINGLINELFAAHQWSGIRRCLVITGDAYEAEQAVVPSRGIFQTDSCGAIGAFHEHLRVRRSLGMEFGAAVNQNALDPEEEGRRIGAKTSAGADFFMSQPVYSLGQAESLLDFYERHSDKPLLVGVWPPMVAKSNRNIAQGKISGVVMPKETYEESLQLEDNEEGLALWATTRSAQLIRYLRERGKVQGVYIVAPARDPLLLLPLLNQIL